MKRKVSVSVLGIVGGVLLSLNALGQIPDQDPGAFAAAPVINIEPGFFMALLVGVLLALGFMLILMNLSLAVGISTIGSFGNKANSKQSTKKGSRGSEQESENSLLVKTINYGGIWGLIIGTISVFFAVLLAVKLSLIPNNIIGVTLGLAIWATFFLVVFYLEGRVASSIIGGLSSTVSSVVKSGISSIGSVISGSKIMQTEDVVDHSINRIEKDVKEAVGGFDIKEKFDEYMSKLESQQINVKHLKEAFADLLNEIKLEEREGENGKEFFLRIAGKDPSFSKKDMYSLGKLYDSTKKSLHVSNSGGVAKTAVSTAKRLKDEVESYLRKTGEEELQPEVLKAELDEIFKNPSSVVEIIKNKVKAFDRDTLVSLIAAREGVERKDAIRVADRVQEAIDKVRGKVQANIDLVEAKTREAKEKSSTLVDKKDQLVGTVEEKIVDKKDQLTDIVEEKIKNFLGKVNKPELNYQRLKLDFALMMKHPTLAPKIIRAKLKEFDTETLVATLAANDSISQEQAVSVAQKFMEAKMEVSSKLARVEAEIEKRVEQAKDFALHEAEVTRKTAVAASWWLLATLGVSGVAAVVAGILAL